MLNKTLPTNRFFLLISGIIALFIAPIILTDFTYRDDYSRIMGGGFWFWNGRLISSAVFYLLNFGYNTKDIAPFVQLMAASLMVLLAWQLHKLFFQGKANIFSAITIGIALTFPIFLDILSYRYDAMMIVLSMCFATGALQVLTQRGGKRDFLGSVLLNLATLLTYQVSMSLFVGLVFLKYLTQISQSDDKTQKTSPKNALRFLGLAAASVIIGYVLYYFITKPFIRGWIGSIKTLPLSDPIFTAQAMWQNILDSTAFFSLFFSNPWTWVLYLLPLFFGYIAFLKRVFASEQNSVYNISRILSLVFALLSPVILYLIALLPIFPLANPLIEAKVFIGLIPLWLFAFRFCADFLPSQKWQFLWIFPLLYGILCSFSYGTAQKNQQQFEDLIISSLIQDLKIHQQIEKINTIIISGEEPISPGAKLFVQEYPMLQLLVLHNLDERYKTLGYLRLKFPLLFIQKIQALGDLDKDLQLQIHQAQVVEQNAIYQLKILENKAIIQYNQ